MAATRYTSVLLTWSTPSQLNGVIISYEVTYRINSSNSIVANSTGVSTTFTISSLTPLTRVSGISVSAYTRIGRGDATTISDLILTQPRKFYSITIHTGLHV